MMNKRLAGARMGTGMFYPFDESGCFNDYISVNGPDDLDKNDVLVVWGGADISPSLYSKAVGKRTGAGVELSKRDAYEWALMQRASKLGIPIIGVCRGAQMLCALAGGFLIQDVTNHGSSHQVITDRNERIPVNSLHHQMMYPFEVDHQMLAWTDTPRSQHYLDVDTPIEVPVEPEAVLFPKVNGLALQWHPEFLDEEHPSTKWVFERMKEHF